MKSICNPSVTGELKECAELGRSLSRLSQPTILAILAENAEPLHGYIIVQKAAFTPMFGGVKPDPTGFYRSLKILEEQGYVTSEWNAPQTGRAKRMYSITQEGRNCLRRWIDALSCYTLSIKEFRDIASHALEIDTPDAPICTHNSITHV